MSSYNVNIEGRIPNTRIMLYPGLDNCSVNFYFLNISLGYEGFKILPFYLELCYTIVTKKGELYA